MLLCSSSKGAKASQQRNIKHLFRSRFKLTDPPCLMLRHLLWFTPLLLLHSSPLLVEPETLWNLWSAVEVSGLQSWTGPIDINYYISGIMTTNRDSLLGNSDQHPFGPRVRVHSAHCGHFSQTKGLYTQGVERINNTKIRTVPMRNVRIKTLHTSSDMNLWQKKRNTEFAKEFRQLTPQGKNGLLLRTQH